METLIRPILEQLGLWERFCAEAHGRAYRTVSAWGGPGLGSNEFLDLDIVIPIHWGTFDLLSGDPETFRALVRRGEVKLPEPGQPLDL